MNAPLRVLVFYCGPIRARRMKTPSAPERTLRRLRLLGGRGVKPKKSPVAPSRRPGSLSKLDEPRGDTPLVVADVQASRLGDDGKRRSGGFTPRSFPLASQTQRIAGD